MRPDSGLAALVGSRPRDRGAERGGVLEPAVGVPEAIHPVDALPDESGAAGGGQRFQRVAPADRGEDRLGIAGGGGQCLRAPDLGEVDQPGRREETERQALAETSRQRLGQRGGRQVEGLDLVEHAGQHAPLFAGAGAGNDEGVLNRLALLQHRHRDAASAAALDRGDQALRAGAVGQAGGGAVDGHGRDLRRDLGPRPAIAHPPPDRRVQRGAGGVVGQPFAERRQERGEVRGERPGLGPAQQRGGGGEADLGTRVEQPVEPEPRLERAGSGDRHRNQHGGEFGRNPGEELAKRGMDLKRRVADLLQDRLEQRAEIGHLLRRLGTRHGLRGQDREGRR
ncbi:hypothetical protein [Amaricoccus solimangrovi]|uniref:Uncharacterized protein n=1 Tax=Amaricoccus solimangrovi TaxID=2589815 RepID=A0A501WWQ4_9RHOB|nr:hypothetical protein FJM51_05785 [Amaricoccus solimangrovi]